MTNSEPLITDADIEINRRNGYPDNVDQHILALFCREPRLAEAMAPHWERIEQLLDGFKLKDIQKSILKTRISLLTSVPLILLDQAHRRHWDGVLPATADTDNGGKNV